MTKFSKYYKVLRNLSVFMDDLQNYEKVDKNIKQKFLELRKLTLHFNNFVCFVRTYFGLRSDRHRSYLVHNNPLSFLTQYF